MIYPLVKKTLRQVKWSTQWFYALVQRISIPLPQIFFDGGRGAWTLSPPPTHPAALRNIQLLVHIHFLFINNPSRITCRMILVSWIIKTEVCVICRSRRLRQITQIRGFDDSWYHVKTEFNNCFIIHFSHNSSSETEAKHSALTSGRRHSTLNKRMPLNKLLSSLFSSFLCPFVFYCCTSAVSSTRRAKHSAILFLRTLQGA